MHYPADFEKKRTYIKKDIVRKIKALTPYLEACQAGLPAAADEYRNFFNRRKDENRQFMQASFDCYLPIMYTISYHL